MSNEYVDVLQERFGQMVGLPIEALLNHIEKDAPSGNNLKHNGIYTSIKDARTADDPTLPMGQWEHDLKAADWEEVTRLSLDALSNKSKDLQIAIWLLEAQINMWGFAAIGPCINFIQSLCEQFWPTMHPEIDDGDIEYRTNLIIWLNEKLQPTVKQLPITAARSDTWYSWAAWEMAAQHEQLPAETRKTMQDDLLNTQTIVSAIIATPIEFYKDIFVDLRLALIALEDFSQSLDNLCGEYSPSVQGLATLLEEIYETLYSHVKHRGLEAAPGEEEEQQEISAEGHYNEDAASGGGAGGNRGPIRNRTDAYARLAEAAEYLSHDDPHSPVPYLVHKAIEWGQMNTAELYQELFIQYQGQLNIFEVMGLELDPKQQRR